MGVIVTTRKRRRRLVNLSACFALGAIWVILWNVRLAQYMPSPTNWMFLEPNESLEYFGAVPAKPVPDNNNPDTIPRRQPTHQACQGKDGLLHIQMGDAGGAAGTIFFQFVIAQILYAERENLVPWVHLSHASYVVYDPAIHDDRSGVALSVSSETVEPTIVTRPYGHWRDKVPGPLQPTTSTTNTTSSSGTRILHFSGTGVWEHYFQPVSPYQPGDISCATKPYVTLSLEMITPGLHRFADWAPRCWRYADLPDYMSLPHLPVHEWLQPMRETAHRVVTEYLRPRDYIGEAAARANPVDYTIAGHNSMHRYNGVLGLHIRHSDKASHRRVVEVDEFLPFCEAFVRAGGQHIYVATDSQVVLETIHDVWPVEVTSKIRTMPEIVRSTDQQAVFDLASHHRTNQEVLVEIYALAACDFLVHGYSAVSEAAIWINLGLHNRSVNLEDPDHLTAVDFEELVRGTYQGRDPASLPHPLQTDAWWEELSSAQERKEPPTPTHAACQGRAGILWISASPTAAGSALFGSILNQLAIAAQYNYVPWIHLQPDTAELLYDPVVHGNASQSMSVLTRTLESLSSTDLESATQVEGATRQSLEVHGNGIWNTYFEPVSEFVPGDKSCKDVPMIRLSEETVESILPNTYPSAIRAWRYDGVSDELWNPLGLSLSEWMQPMRQRAAELVGDFYRFRPAIRRRADKVNPVTKDEICLGVHLRNADKEGQYRQKIKAHVIEDYLQAFVQAGGDSIYVATDSHKAWKYIHLNFDSNLTSRLRSQGKYVVRTFQEYPTHLLADHHRVNSEVLVDIVALSKCQFLLHTYTTTAEAAIYLNPTLQNASINLEDPKALSPSQFELFVRRMLGQNSTEIDPVAVWTGDDRFVVDRMDDTTIARHKSSRTACASNAIVYLAQKVHSTYGRDSLGSLLKSLKLLHQNYLSLNRHMESVDVFIFHTGDFGPDDLIAIEEVFGTEAKGSVRLVDLSGSPYWQRPPANLHDNPKQDWYAYPLFSEGYRRMMHWFAIDIWKFFTRLNEHSGCAYRYLWRLDEDSFVHSPIQYDMFEFMQSHKYQYGFRMCAYEMQVTKRMWTLWNQRHPHFVPQRPLEFEMCGFYNNLFVADLAFFQSEPVREFLDFIDGQGHIYRRRLGDLMIHSMVVYAFSPPERIHRFLDFTYEHGTVNQTNGCLVWGGIQAGYDDSDSAEILNRFKQTMLVDRNCSGNSTILHEPDLSPTYQHIPDSMKGTIGLLTITAGRVELPEGRGILSG